MKKYEPTKLLAYCMKISKIKNNGTSKENEIKELIEEYINKAKEIIEKENELLLTTTPEEIFYFKKPKTKELGFYKEYLEEDTVKKYKNDLKKILLIPEKFIEETKELDEATNKFTYGKIKTFKEYYLKAYANYKNKKINEIAIKLLREDYKI